MNLPVISPIAIAMTLLFPAGLFAQSAPAVNGGGGGAVPSDATGISDADRDPLAWLGDREVKFVAAARQGGAILRSGPNHNYGKVRMVPEGELVLVVGELPPDHLEVLVPGGFHAYIHSRFVDVDEFGLGKVNTDRVNLRSRPQSVGDYPITQLGLGDELLVWGPAIADPNWLDVTPLGAVTIWSSDDEIPVVGELTGELLDRVIKAREVLDAEFDARSAQHREAALLAAAHEAQQEQIPELVNQARETIAAERNRGGTADLTGARRQLDKILALEPEGAHEALAASLANEIDDAERQRDAIRERDAMIARLEVEKQRLLAATKNRSQGSGGTTTTPPQNSSYPVAVPVVTPTLPNTSGYTLGQQDRWTGFLRHRPTDTAHPLAIEQGTKVIAYVTCTSARYELRDFIGQQLTVKGRVNGVGTHPTVDVDRIEIVR